MDDIKKLEQLFLIELKKVKNINDINNLQVKYLGKNSEFFKLVKNIKNLPDAEKKETGKKIHFIKIFILEKIKEKRIEINDKLINDKLKSSKIDVTLPEVNLEIGNNHPITIIKNEVKDIFKSLGYKFVSGTEVDDVKYVFELLDMHKDHPARNHDDCFYINDRKMLRTHCTNVTAKMVSMAGKDVLDYDIGIISTGNVYRRDTDDATHSHQFSQIDGVLIGKNISFANLKWTLQYLCKRLFGTETQIRMRPSYFPFTRISAEVDVSCFYCQSKGCRICKNTGWIEILGSGMLGQNVLKLCNVPKGISALAFGIGVERLVMLKYGVDDIRKLYTNDLQFLKQFKHF